MTEVVYHKPQPRVQYFKLMEDELKCILDVKRHSFWRWRRRKHSLRIDKQESSRHAFRI